MIVATRSVDGPLKGIVSKSSLMISRIESITQSIQLDPKVSSPAKEMFVISSDDVRNSKVKVEVSKALQNKHKDAVIMFINKTGKPIPGMEEHLFQSYLSKPSQKDVNEEFVRLVKELEEKPKFGELSMVDDVEDFQPEAPVIQKAADEDDLGGLVINKPSKLDIPVIEHKDEELEGNSDPALLQRIRSSENWAVLTTIAKEVNAARVVQEVNEANASYRASENYVTSLSENVTAIMSNPEYNTVTKLNKVRAILHTKANIKAKTNTILEQSVDSIVMAIVDRAKEEVQSVTEEIDKKIIRAFAKKEVTESPNVRLATIIEQRAKTLVELNTLDLELKGLSSVCVYTINDTVSNVIGESSSPLGAPLLDSKMKERYGAIVPENLLEVLDNLFQTGVTASKEMGVASDKIHSTIRKLYQLLSLYQEEQEVLAETIRYLKANRVEDTVIANTIMKKCMGLYITSGDFESEAVTYLISRNKSYRNDNVLVVDVTGSGIWNTFGIKTDTLAEFENSDMYGKFNVLTLGSNSGYTSDTSHEFCQRLMSKLVGLAKHYSVISIVSGTNHTVLNEFFAPEVMSVNYVVSCLPNYIKEMKDVIKATMIDNTANRLILTDYIPDAQAICKELDVMDYLNMQLVPCPSVKEVRLCALHTQDPYDVESIVKEYKGVFNVC